MSRIFIASLALLASAPSFAASVTLSRATRPVTATEIAGGAPLGGYVHDFFVTSSSDLLSIGQVKVTAPLFQHTLGSDVSAPQGITLSLSDSLTADSFITLPGQTSSIGGGFAGGPGEQMWFDVTNDGPQQDAHWARLTTTGHSGEFTGRVSVRGYDSVVSLPFQFALPGVESDLAILASEAPFTLEYSLDPPPAPAPAAPGPLPPVALPAPSPALPEPPMAIDPAPLSEQPLPELAEQPAELPNADMPDVYGEDVVPPTIELVFGGGAKPLPIWAFDPPNWDGTLVVADNLLRHFRLVDADGMTHSLRTSGFTALDTVATMRHLILGGSLLAVASTGIAFDTPIPEPTAAGLALTVILVTLSTMRRRP